MKSRRVAAWVSVLALLLVSAAWPQGEPKNETHQNQDGTWTQTNTHPDGSKTVTEMDKDRHNTKSTEYDAKGNKIEENDWAWNAAEKQDVMRRRHIYKHGSICESVYEYDENGVRLKVTVWCEGYEIIDTYMAGKHIKREKIVDGKVVKTEHFDENGKLIQHSLAQPSAPPVITPGASSQDSATARLVGLVYDKDSRPGDQVTVSLTSDPKKYENIPALGVIEMRVPTAPGATGQAALQGLVVDLGDGRQQPANQALTIQVPQNATGIPVTISQQGIAIPAAQSSVPMNQAPSATAVTNTGKASDFTTPPIVQATSIIYGPLSGNGSATHITVDNQPASIVTETPRRGVFSLPPGMGPGGHTLTLQDGQREASAPILKMGLLLNAGQLKLQRGQSTSYTATVQLGSLPDAVWQHGGGSCPELMAPSDTSNLATNFHVPQAGEPAVVFFRVDNASRDTVTIKPSQNEVVTRVLHRQDFKNNQYTEAGTIQSKKSGSFVLNAVVQSFFAPISFNEALASGTSKVNCGLGCGTERSVDEDGTKWVWCVDKGCENTAGCECHVLRNYEDPPGSGKWKHEDMGKHNKNNKQKEDGKSTYTASCEPS